MTIKINRRSFLQALIALGASYTLPENASAQQIDQAWETAQVNPWHFAVDQWGTITDPSVAVIEKWSDVFWIGTKHLNTIDNLINEINECQPLINHFQDLATEELHVLYDELDQSPGILRRKQLQKIIQAIESDPDNGWQDWITLQGKQGFDRFKKEIDTWLNEPVDHMQSEWFPLDYGSQGQAKSFFEVMDRNTLEALQVVIVEGEHPGSTYYAAELRQCIDEANVQAKSLGLPFRFKEVAV
jgi:hypothetical protein